MGTAITIWIGDSKSEGVEPSCANMLTASAEPEVRLDTPVDPRIGMVGVSYGGSLPGFIFAGPAANTRNLKVPTRSTTT